MAARFDVGVPSVTRWIKDIHRKPQGFLKRKIDLDVLRQNIIVYPDAYQYERAKRLGVAQNAAFLALKELGVIYKKTLTHPKAYENSWNIFQDKITAYEAAGRAIFNIDKSGFTHDAPRRHGYAPIGQRCHCTHDWHAEARINADVFHGWAMQDLLPKLPSHSIVVMDNATFHKRQDTRYAIQNAGHTLDTCPLDFPDLNLIEP